MSPEDLATVIARLRDDDPALQQAALQTLHNAVSFAQGASPAEAQDLVAERQTFLECAEKLHGDARRHLYDLISVLSMLDDDPRLLRYRLMGGATELSTWSIQYVRRLAAAVANVFTGVTEAEDCEALVPQITSVLLAHNSEAEAIDFALEVSGREPFVDFEHAPDAFTNEIRNLVESENDGELEVISTKQHAEGTAQPSELRIGTSPQITEVEETEQRAAPEQTSTAVPQPANLPNPTDSTNLESAKAQNTHSRPSKPQQPLHPRTMCVPNAFEPILAAIDDANRERILLYLEDLARFYPLDDICHRAAAHDPSRQLVALLRRAAWPEAIEHVRAITHPAARRQCLYILARFGLRHAEGLPPSEAAILSNTHMAPVFAATAAALEVEAPKKIDGLFKGLNRDRADVATVANAFVHCAFGRDPVFFPLQDDYQAKAEHVELMRAARSVAATASVGLLHAFNPARVYELYESRILEAPEVGAVLALALAACQGGDADGAVLNLLSLFLGGETRDVIAALFGVALLYAGSRRAEIYEAVFPLLSSPDSNVSLFAIYVLGSVFPGDWALLGSCLDVYAALSKDSFFNNFAILGLALFCYAQGAVDTAVLARMPAHARVLARALAVLGSGDPAVLAALLGESFIGEIDALLESLGLLAAAVVGIGDPIATQLAERITTSALLLESAHLKSMVPMCLAMLYASNPRSEVVDILEKSINSGECAVAATVALGIVGAGTSSARIMRILDASYAAVYKDARASAALMYARGLVNMGKGLFTLSPLAFDRRVVLPRGAIGLLSTFFLFLEPEALKDYSFLLYFPVMGFQPRYITMDTAEAEAGEAAVRQVDVASPGSCVSAGEVSVRIGKPVDTVGMAGNPSKISATVVHSLPAILAENERAVIDVPVWTRYVEDVLVPRRD